MALHFKTLGMPELFADGQAVRMRYRKVYALLGYLVVEHDRWHERRRLAELFWPRLASEAARANLRLVLKSLADVMVNAGGEGVLRIERERLGLFADPAVFDADLLLFGAGNREALRRCGGRAGCSHLFAAWETRLAQLEGDFLAGVDTDEGGGFEEWLQVERGAVECARHAFLRECVATARRCDAPAAARLAARAWVRCRPTDDEAAQAHMEFALALDGPGAALDAYADFARRLEILVGTAPAPETERLRRDIAAARPVDSPVTPVTRDEVRRVVVLHLEPELADEVEVLEPERILAPLCTAFDAVLTHWGGRQFPAAGMALGAVFGLAEDGEQAPRRALHAACELAAQSEFRRARIGLAEGRALIAPSVHQPIAGSLLPALAQRLAICGEPGGIVAAESLAAESGAGFEPMPRRRFAGLAGEHAPCRIAASAHGHGNACPTVFATPFVGRDGELAFLADRLKTAGHEGNVRFLQISGLPGTGKSRLLAEFARRHRAAGGEVRWVGHWPESRHVALGALRGCLSWRGEERGGLAGQQLIDAMIARLFAPSVAGEPVLLIFDDLHWADETTRELLAIVLRNPPPVPVLALLASRPTLAPATASLPCMTLTPLTMPETIALIAAADPDGRIDTLRRAQLARISGGLPLCAEYIARTASDRPVSDASLFGVLQGVLDRLGPDKPVVQAAAVFGAAFGDEALRELLPEHNVAAALERAAALAIVERNGQGMFAFHHALLRDCAYDSTPPPRRRDWHRRAAAWLARQPQAVPADIAQHYEAGEAWLDARDAWRRAAETAYLDEFAAEAAKAAERARAAAARLGSAAPDVELELLSGFATLMTDGYGARGAQKFFAPLLDRPAGELPEETRFRALAGMVAAYPQGRGENLEAMGRLEALARTSAHRLNVHYGFGSLLFWRGEFARSLAHLDAAIEVGAGIPPHQWLRYSADNPVVNCLALKAVNLAFSADAETAVAAAAAAVQTARGEGRIHGLCFALTLAAGVHCLLDRPDDTARLAAEGLELASARQYQFWQAYNAIFSLWAEARHGAAVVKKSFRLLSLHREIAAASRLSPVTSWWVVAIVCEAVENWPLLDMIAARALSLAENGGDTYCMPDLLRQRALARHGRGDARGARRWLDMGFAQARAQGNHGLLVRLARTAGRLGMA